LTDHGRLPDALHRLAEQAAGEKQKNHGCQKHDLGGAR